MTTIRPETPYDIPAIHILNQEAFGGRNKGSTWTSRLPIPFNHV